MNYLVEPTVATASTCTCNCLIFIGTHDPECTKTSCTSKASGGCSVKEVCVSPTGVKLSPTSIEPQSY